MNFQPDELGGAKEPCRKLGGAKEPCRKRQAAWSQMCNTFGLVLHNPALDSNSVHSIRLPLREKMVSIQEGSTRHGPGIGRAIDLVFSSDGLYTDVTIHNSVHCSDSCPLQGCQETCRGDHFLLQIDVNVCPSWSSGPAAPVFPGRWHNQERWKVALRPAEAALQCLGDLSLVAGDEVCLFGPSLARQEQHVWGIEASSALATTIASLVRDVWLGSGPLNLDPRQACLGSPNLAEAVLHDLTEDSKRLLDSLSRETNKSALLNACLKLLRDPAPVPLPCLINHDTLLSEEESNKEWASALKGQCSWEMPFDRVYHAATISRYDQLCSIASAAVPLDNLDFAVTEREVVDVKCNWSTSKGMPPDLLPRALFQAESPGWNLCLWALQRWAGPGGAAYRPSLWRKAALCPVHKSGPANLAASFRLIFVKVQMGLMQEALLTQRWLSRTRQHTLPCQSGYVRGVEDAHLLLHEICAEAILQRRALWFVMGDFRKAFPNVCREDLLCTLAEGPRVNGQCLKLLASILKHDTVVIWHSGYSEVTITQGIPEGGTLGPFGYPVLLDTLVRELLAHNCGLGVGWVIPRVWQGRHWCGLGQPNPVLVDRLKSALRAPDPDGLLPSSALLSANPNLEASALQALNDLAPLRIAAILHADDPVLLGCCKEALQQSLDILARWAFKHKASFHVGEKKTVAMVTPSPLFDSCSPPGPALALKGMGGQADRALGFKASHKWLGMQWSANLSLSVALHVRVAIAQKAFALLAGLAQRNTLPLHLVASIFWSKVFSSLCLGSWLFSIAPEAQRVLDAILQSWAKQLLGASQWQNAAVAMSELGWDTSGFFLVASGVALRRAKLWSLPVC